MAAVSPQTILWEFQRLSPAGTLVEAATSQSRWDVVRHHRDRDHVYKKSYMTQPEITKKVLHLRKIKR